MTDRDRLTYTIDEAAARLGAICPAGWLRKHLDEIPHLRSAKGTGTGRANRVAFTEAHLAEILLLLERRPSGSPDPSPEQWPVATRRRSA